MALVASFLFSAWVISLMATFAVAWTLFGRQSRVFEVL